MISKHSKKAAGIAAVVALGVSGSAFAGDRAAGIVYKGNSDAMNVCMSIVHDDVSGLKYAFRRGRSDLLEQSHLVYECNDMRLDEFAFTQNAMQVHSYLAPKYPNEGNVTIEQVGSIDQ